MYILQLKNIRRTIKKNARHGTPEQRESDQWTPFNSREFAKFASEDVFKQHCVTPLHPQANGDAKNFMKLLNRTEQRARIENKPVGLAIQDKIQQDIAQCLILLQASQLMML